MINIKTATITEKGQITIPKGLRDIKGFKEGSKIVIMSFKDYIEIRPISEFEKVKDRFSLKYPIE